MAGRRYDEDEVRELIRRATELQESGEPKHSGGLSLEEVQKVAGELGIAPHHIARAANQLDSKPAASPLAKSKNKGSTMLTRHVDQALSEATWDEMVAVMREHYQTVGHIAGEGRQHSWTCFQPARMLSVSLAVTTTGGRSTLALSSNTIGKPGLIMLVPVLIVFVSVISLSSISLNVSFLAAIIAVALIGAAIGLYVRDKMRAKSATETSALLDRLVDCLDRVPAGSAATELISIDAPAEQRVNLGE